MTSGVGFAQSLDEKVLARARHGDMQAYAAIYQLYGRTCYSLALRLLGNAAAAEDMVQDVFLKLMNSIRSFRGDAPFGAWLKRMMVNGCIDAQRTTQRHAGDDAELILARHADAAILPEYSQDLQMLLQRLSARARTVLVLHELEGYTHKELAELFNQTESYSKSILARTLLSLNNFVLAPTSSDGVDRV